MMSKLLMLFLLIYILSCGCHNERATQVAVATQHSIARPASLHLKPKIKVRKILRELYKKKTQEQYIPPVEFYLDPPKIPSWDESRLA
jgi:hypothetical protein